MLRKLLFTVAVCFSLSVNLWSQSPYHELVKDTIITHPKLLGNAFLLGGKRLNIQVMQWFMTGHPLAHDQVRVALVSDQLSAASFTLGGMILLGGLLIRQNDQQAGEDLLLMGAAGIGAGLLFTIVSNGHKRRAVQLYNEDIKRYHNSSPGVGVKLGFGGNGLTLRLF